MDNQQLRKEYDRFCMFCFNPPSFETWLKQRVEFNPEDYAERCRKIATELQDIIKGERR